MKQSTPMMEESINVPTTKLLNPVASQAQVEVAWNAPANNGDAISGYELRVKQGSSVVKTVPVAAGQTTAMDYENAADSTESGSETVRK